MEYAVILKKIVLFSTILVFSTGSVQHHHTTCTNVGALEGIVDSLSELNNLAKEKIANIEGTVCPTESTDKKLHFFVEEDVNCKNLPHDCASFYYKGNRLSSVYKIWPTFLNHSISVFCDMDTSGGGWTVIQRRGDFKDNVEGFYQPWDLYKKGFGNLSAEFWLGNDAIFALTNQNKLLLRIDLEDFEGNKRFAEYLGFVVRSEMDKYNMTFDSYRGDAGDGMATSNGMSFTTKDRDNDKWIKNCAETYKGAWWYSACHDANLNGLYLRGKHKEHAVGVNWKFWKGYEYSLKVTEMKLRPVGFVPSSEAPK